MFTHLIDVESDLTFVQCMSHLVAIGNGPGKPGRSGSNQVLLLDVSLFAFLVPLDEALSILDSRRGNLRIK
jgi:hypothetical protein